MNTAKCNAGFLRKNLAQDRLNKLREELKLKRKIHEKLEKFTDQQSTSKPVLSSKDVLIDKFLPNANQVKVRGAKRTVEVEQSTHKKIHKPHFLPERNQPLKSPRGKAGVIRSCTGNSNEKSISARNQGNAQTRHIPHSFGAEYSCLSSASNNSSDKKINFSGQKNRICKKRKRGIGPQRLENARKCALENALRNGNIGLPVERAVIQSTSQPSTKLPDQIPSNTNMQLPTETESRKSEAKESVFSFSKLPSDTHLLSETGSVSGKSPLTSSELASTAHSQTETKLQQPMVKVSTSTFTKFEPSTKTSEECNSFKCDMDVDMDIDSGDSFLTTNMSANSPTRVSEKWLERKKEDDSFFVNEIERIREDSAYLARHEQYISDVEMNLSVPSGDFLIIVDTNIFLSHLRFLHRLLKSRVSNYRAHVLLVPWVVIQEIDYAMKKKDQQLASQAKLANHFIFECLKKEKSNFFGQSFEDFKVNFKNTVSVDDFLLQYCLKLKSLRHNVVLLSDDKNLCNKCMFSNVAAYTRDEFEKTFDIDLLQ